MLIIKIGKNENINSALKRFKRKVKNTGMIKELRERQQFVKPSVAKRKSKQQAIKTEKYRRENEEI